MCYSNPSKPCGTRFQTYGVLRLHNDLYFDFKNSLKSVYRPWRIRDVSKLFPTLHQNPIELKDTSSVGRHWRYIIHFASIAWIKRTCAYVYCYFDIHVK